MQISVFASRVLLSSNIFIRCILVLEYVHKHKKYIMNNADNRTQESRVYDSVFYIDTEKIKPNPYQPRREFDEAKLRELASSIRAYGILQPIVVTRKEVETPDGGLVTEYELISGERRTRASKIAGLPQIPAVIRATEDTDRMKLELAIIENLQREDLNPLDRALAFKKLVDDFGFTKADVARKIGRSREYVANTLRMLMLPQEILDSLVAGSITEGHTRPLLMLVDRPLEQMTLYKEITFRRLTVRDAEGIARRIAYDKVRKKENLDPEIIEIEEKLKVTFGTRVQIDKKANGGKVTIDFFSNDDLRKILETMQTNVTDGHVIENLGTSVPEHPSQKYVSVAEMAGVEKVKVPDEGSNEDNGFGGDANEDLYNVQDTTEVEESAQDNETNNTEKEKEKEQDQEELYSMKNFSL
ncbi:ParB/RepB/Spo0J family partition protein [Patescibacteria group bacterium]